MRHIKLFLASRNINDLMFGGPGGDKLKPLVKQALTTMNTETQSEKLAQQADRVHEFYPTENNCNPISQIAFDRAP